MPVPWLPRVAVTIRRARSPSEALGNAVASGAWHHCGGAFCRGRTACERLGLCAVGGGAAHASRAAPRSRRSKPCRYGCFGFCAATEERRRAGTGSCRDRSQLLGSPHRATIDRDQVVRDSEKIDHPTALRAVSGWSAYLISPHRAP